MKRNLLTLMLAAALMAPAAGFASGVYYGFAPAEADAAQLTSIGSGKNAFLEAVVRVDPSADPLVKKLKGHKITGVRFYLRADYRQKNKGFSCIRLYDGELKSVSQSRSEDFVQGWNEFTFDTPVTIGDAPVYVGYQLYETQGEPYPISAYKSGRLGGLCLINAARNGWADYGERGVLMIQAVVDADPSDVAGFAVAAPMDAPLVVAPDTDFSCSLYVHNQGAEPLKSLEYTARDGAGDVTSARTVTFDSPVPPFGSAVVGATLKAPSAEGSSVPLRVSATKVNDLDAGGCYSTSLDLYVSTDVFYRVPAVEEFTGILCNSCPFMFYYLDRALENMTTPHVYVAHHAGYVKDVLTKECDNALLYLFDGPTSNPAVMYDRRVMSGNFCPVENAKNVASYEPYTLRLNEAMGYPALAKVLVNQTISASGAECRVRGKISKAALDLRDDLYLTVYLIEDRIPTEVYGQQGLNPLPEGAPDDLLDRFCHRGVIRHYFGGELGDKLTVDDEGNFDVSYSVGQFTFVNIDNCEIVAMVHRVNKDNISDNYILNAGAERFNDYAENGAALPVTLAEGDDVPAVTVGADRVVGCADPGARLSVYTLDGRRLSAARPLAPGLYVVAVGREGRPTVAVRLLVR